MSFLSFIIFKIGIHAFVSSEKCSRNAYTPLITNRRKSNHITLVLASLHCLAVYFQIDFKLLILGFKALNGLAPPTAVNCCSGTNQQDHLACQLSFFKEIPTARNKHWGEKGFCCDSRKNYGMVYPWISEQPWTWQFLNHCLNLSLASNA